MWSQSATISGLSADTILADQLQALLSFCRLRFEQLAIRQIAAQQQNHRRPKWDVALHGIRSSCSQVEGSYEYGKSSPTIRCCSPRSRSWTTQ